MKISRNNIIILAMLITTAALALSSCGRRAVYSHFETISREGWDKADTMHFIVPAGNGGNHAMTLGLRANSAYPYTDVTLSVGVRTAKTGEIRTDTVSIDITDKDGNSLGTGLGVRQFSAVLSTIDTMDGDTITITITHAMERRILPGITDVGITMEE